MFAEGQKDKPADVAGADLQCENSNRESTSTEEESTTDAFHLVMFLPRPPSIVRQALADAFVPPVTKCSLL